MWPAQFIAGIGTICEANITIIDFTFYITTLFAYVTRPAKIDHLSTKIADFRMFAVS